MPFAGSMNIQASFGGITANNIDSGAAEAGKVLTADGSGGAGWQGIPLVVITTGDWNNQANVFFDIQTSLPYIIPPAGFQVDVIAACLDSPWVAKLTLDSSSVNFIASPGSSTTNGWRMAISVINTYEL